jgi:hypothetical protein
MKNIEMLLPEFAKMVLKVSTQYKIKPRVLFSHNAFSDKEHELMGSAIKFCALKNIGVIVLGEKQPDVDEVEDLSQFVKDMKVMTKVKTDIEIDSEEYSVYDVAALGKKVKNLAKKHESVFIPSKYLRLCENCGGNLEDENIRPEDEARYYWGIKDEKEFSVAVDEKLNRK